MRLVWLAAAALACGCPGGGGNVKRPYPEPTVEDLLARLGKVRAARTSFVADTTMDYWLGNQRAKGEVMVMGTPGSHVRFAALSPAGGSTLAEMACDGSNFVYVDYQNNCVISGPCDSRSIAEFFRIELAPDDFVHMAMGTPPVLEGAKGTLTWDHGHEVLQLESPQGKEKLVLDASREAPDVIEAEMRDASGKVQWTVMNADFGDVAGQRLPAKTRFKSPGVKEDLLVEWGERRLNEQLPQQKFELTAPQGLAQCGHKP